jgi:hypothetical protein
VNILAESNEQKEKKTKKKKKKKSKKTKERGRRRRKKERQMEIKEGKRSGIRLIKYGHSVIKTSRGRRTAAPAPALAPLVAFIYRRSLCETERFVTRGDRFGPTSSASASPMP